MIASVVDAAPLSTVRFALVLAVQPFEPVAVTLKVLGLVGLTVILALVWPFDHVKVPFALAVKVVEPPWHTAKLPLIEGVGKALTTTFWVFVAVQPLADVAVTV